LHLYSSLPSIIIARKKPIEVVAFEDLAVTIDRRFEIVGLEIASSQRMCKRVKDVDELIHHLRHEAKVV
jgi:electron transfer flavoprotein beta subunit